MNKLIEQIKRHEGFSSKPYRDTVGKLTIAYGRNLDDKGISLNEAEALLVNDLVQVRDRLIGFPWYIALRETRRDVIANMAFNLGVRGLLSFKRMIAALNIMDFENAAEEMMRSAWAGQVGARADELAEQMRTGKYR